MISKNIEAFLNFYQASKTDYLYAQEQLKKCQDYTQDILHSLELDNLSYSDRCKLMTKLTACRKDRRYWKDQVEELEPLVSVFSITADTAHKKAEVERNAKVINLLREALGQTRRQENYHKDRKYTPRIFTKAEATKC
jgi:hypothetical protein